ncbi:MAG: hypothetical protein Q9172_007772, partial [Xanthocarpia lactea]
PKHSARESARDRTPSSRDPSAHSGCAPENLALAGAAEADGGDGDDPAVVMGEAGEGEEDEGPDEEEEGEEQENDGGGGGVVGGPKVLPVAGVGSGEEVILEDCCYEEPLFGLWVSKVWGYSFYKNAEVGRGRNLQG